MCNGDNKNREFYLKKTISKKKVQVQIRGRCWKKNERGRY